jgi:putative ABC transport system permease protein
MASYVMATSWKEWASGMLTPLLACSVLLIAMIISYIQGLGIEKEMLIAISRAFLQLSVIGFVLEFIFNQTNAGWIAVAYLFMVSFSAIFAFIL